MAAIPDVVRAFVNHTRTRTNITALTGTRISGRLRIRNTDDPTGWLMPAYAIVYRMVPGPVRRRAGTTPVRGQPIQYECYGATVEAATALWTTLYAEMFPDTSPPTPQGFIAAGCAVMSIEEIGAPGAVQENPNDFPRVVGTWLATYAERSVPI